MWVFTSVADWIDEKGAQSDSVLDKWVEDSHYNNGVMVAAATTHAFMQFGSSMTDVLRLGDGIRSGTLRGVGADTLRFIAIFPLGKAAQMLKSAAFLKNAKLIPNISGPNCAWVATTKALAQIGHKVNGGLLTHVHDLARAVGHPISELGGISMESMGHNLYTLGAKIGGVYRVNSMNEIIARGLLKRDGSVVLIGVRCMRNAQEVEGHLVYAYYDTWGRLRFMDRTITKAAQKTYSSLEEILLSYKQFDAFIPKAAMPLYNVFVKSAAHETPRLAMPIPAVIAQYREQKTQVTNPTLKKLH